MKSLYGPRNVYATRNDATLSRRQSSNSMRVWTNERVGGVAVIRST